MADMMKKRSTKRQAQIQTLGDNIDWEVIRANAVKFAADWAGERDERKEAHTFWDEFFQIFGRNRRGLGVYEYYARIGRDDKRPELSGQGFKQGRIDMLWPGVLAVEHKSASQTNMKKGEAQLMEYIAGLPDDKKPRWGLVCNFARFRLIDLGDSPETSQSTEFPLRHLPDNAELFKFFIEEERRQFTLKLKASQDAAEMMGRVYDALAAANCHAELERLLMRLLFCMFADSTGVWEKGAFSSYLHNRTHSDGGDLGMHLESIFDTLNSSDSKRANNLHPSLRVFPYVNGGLFADRIRLASFDEASRAVLLEACGFDWSGISPDIFGALFQTVREPAARREGGEHYTSEENILKVIRPLFLDNLEKCLHRAKNNHSALKTLHSKIAAMRFLDPACGCGNFLIVAYRELRRLEAAILRRLYPNKPALDIKTLCRVNVDQFHGIEIDSFPARIAETALWLVDHQMNLEVSNNFGGYWTRIPLTVSPNIVNRNALELEWESVAPAKTISHIFGNPPFAGRQYRTLAKRREIKAIFNGANGAGKLDYVCAWYKKAAGYIRGTPIRCAFVSTNSITQGEQVAALWGAMNGGGIKIHFAHRSFKWRNEGRSVAQVYVVIVGFGEGNEPKKIIYQYDDEDGEPTAVAAANINAYLQDAPDVIVKPRTTPLRDAPAIVFGSMPNDGGHLLLDAKERKEILNSYPQARPFILPAIGAHEYLREERRWCIWLDGAAAGVFRKIRPIMARVKKVQEHRAASDRETTRGLSPHLFGERRHVRGGYILIPLNTSKNRSYIPIGMIRGGSVALNSCAVVPGGDLYYFGVLSSEMHMAWMRAVGGRLGVGYRYSNNMIYNTFPWPEKITAAKKQKIKECAQKVLDMRKRHSGNSSLGDMYSSMPPELERAHRALDLAVDRAYRRQPFASERNRMEYLFSEYHRLTAPVIPPPKKKRTRRRV